MNRHTVRGLALLALAAALYGAGYLGSVLPIEDERVILALAYGGEACLVILFVVFAVYVFRRKGS